MINPSKITKEQWGVIKTLYIQRGHKLLPKDCTIDELLNPSTMSYDIANKLSFELFGALKFL
jgi:hypothetical protein